MCSKDVLVIDKANSISWMTHKITSLFIALFGLKKGPHTASGQLKDFSRE